MIITDGAGIRDIGEGILVMVRITGMTGIHHGIIIILITAITGMTILITDITTGIINHIIHMIEGLIQEGHIVTSDHAGVDIQ